MEIKAQFVKDLYVVGELREKKPFPKWKRF